MAAKNTLLLLFISYIISLCIAQGPPNDNGDQNDANIYVGSIGLLPDQFGNPRNFAQVTIDYDNDRVEIVLEGTDSAWNGIGFGQQIMEGTYAIIMDYEFQQGQQPQPIVFEVILGDHASGDQLEGTNINIDSDIYNATNVRRKITVTRPIQAASNPGYSFPDQPQQGSTDPIILQMIAAQGPGYDFFIPPTNRHSFFDREPNELVLFRGGLSTNVTGFESTFDTSFAGDVCCECQVVPSNQQQGGSGGCLLPDDSFDEICNEEICPYDSYCCDVRFDSLCSAQASNRCNDAPRPLCCGCTVGQGGPGCQNDPECEDVVCPNDVYCCGGDQQGNGFWDLICTNTALTICEEMINEGNNNDNNGNGNSAVSERRRILNEEMNGYVRGD